MTRQEAFKRRIRARMAKTGERYAAARQALVADAGDHRQRWVSAPDVDDASVRDATGRGWDEWRALLDAWPGNDDGHAAIAAHLQDELGIPGWWAQTVTVGYERITGRRLPHQRPDGTFTAGVSRTVATDPGAVRELLLDDEGRALLFPGHETVLRSRPTAKSLRVAIGPGVALFSLEPRADGRTKVTVAHERLPSVDEVPAWRDYWTSWLEALHDPGAADDTDDALPDAGGRTDPAEG